MTDHTAYLMDRHHLTSAASPAPSVDVATLLRQAAATDRVVVLVPTATPAHGPVRYRDAEVSAVRYAPGMDYPAWVIRLIGLNVLRLSQRSAVLVAATATGVRIVSPGDWLIDRQDTVEVLDSAFVEAVVSTDGATELRWCPPSRVP